MAGIQQSINQALYQGSIAAGLYKQTPQAKAKVEAEQKAKRVGELKQSLTEKNLSQATYKTSGGEKTAAQLISARKHTLSPEGFAEAKLNYDTVIKEARELYDLEPSAENWKTLSDLSKQWEGINQRYGALTAKAQAEKKGRERLEDGQNTRKAHGHLKKELNNIINKNSEGGAK